MYDKILNQLERNRKLIVIAFFALFFLTSLSILKDYGLSWDEEFQWRQNGEIVYNYVFHNDRKALLDGNEKYHGPAFELILVLVQKALHLTDTRDVYLMRHFVTFLTFFTGVIFFYFLCKRSFKSWKIALTGCLFLVLSPRIFAESFYNSKDPIFLVLFIIGMYGLLIYHERQTYKNAILYALACAFTIDTRILGIILPLTSFCFIGIEFIHSTIANTKERIHYGSLITFTILLPVFTLLFWPVLWKDTLFHFTAALSEMSKYHWGGSLLYRGVYLKATELPWHYLPVWISISTPVAYLLLFPVGLFFIGKQFCAGPMNFIIHKKEQLLALIVFFLPLLMVIVLKSAVYDGWRHVFFIYPAFIMIVLYGLKYIYSLLPNPKRIFIFFLTLITIGFNLVLLIDLHPYENVYFNFLAGKDMKEVKQNFELDYYGVSSKQALDYILKNDPSVKLNIYAEQYPQQLNAQYLPAEQRNRIKFSEMEYADYFITQYRFHRQPYDFRNEIFSAKVGNATILSVFKLSDSEKRSIGPQGKIWKTFRTDFEEQLPERRFMHIFKPTTGAHSGERVTMTNVIHPFSDGLKFEIPDTLCNKEGLVLKVTLWKYEDIGSESNVVVDVKNKDSANVYFWNGINSKPLVGTIRKWDQFSATVQLPVIKSPLDEVSVYLWNVGKTPIMMDDIEVQLIEKQGKQFQIDYLK
jgi:hypothetical protein